MTAKKSNWIEDLVEQQGILRTAERNLNKPILCEKQSRFKILGDNENKEGAQRKVFLVVTPNTRDEQHIQDIFTAIKTIIPNILTEEDVYATLVGDGDTETVRKLLELAFQHTSTKVNMVQPDLGKKKTSTTESVLVRAGEISYADMARKIKDGLNPETVGVNVTAFRETKKGDVLIVTKKGEAETLRAEIESRVGNAQIETRFGTEHINILDLDPSCTEDEIAEAVSVTLEKPKEIVKVKSLRPNRYGNSIATVSLPAPEADKLCKIGAVKVGWVWCRAKPRINVDRCLNCLELGHTTNSCKKPRELVRKCFNCAQPGHMASSCNNEKYCLKCEVTGHRNDTFSCPQYREMAAADKRGYRRY
ncbi:hypothetical protein WDU94_012353 [Cyamophila willieti]